MYYNFGAEDAPDHIDVPLPLLSLYLQRETFLQKLRGESVRRGGATVFDNDKISSFAEDNYFIFNKEVSKYRSFFPDLLNKVDLISQENEIRQYNHNLSHASASMAGDSVHQSGNRVGSGVPSTVGAGAAKNLLQVGSHAPVATVNRIVFVDSGSAPSKDKAVKNRRKEDAQKERVVKFLQGSLGIAMASANPDQMPVLVSDLPWADLRGLSTALSSGNAGDVSFFFSTKAAIKRTLKLIVNELRHRASITVDNMITAHSPGAGQAVPGGSGITVLDTHLHYALLYSTKDDRFDMVSYTFPMVSLPTL